MATRARDGTRLGIAKGEPHAATQPAETQAARGRASLRLLDLPRRGDSTELLSHCGFDAFIVDHEHIGADFRTLIEQLRAAQASDTTVLLRVPSHDPVYIKRALDAGVDGIVVPTLETADEARAVVAATRYRPQGGDRGVGYPESRAATWGLAETAYPREYLDELLLAGIIETRKGIENLPAILAVQAST
jgi:4-hydroxy-2-oxoheptanedioate aldolase